MKARILTRETILDIAIQNKQIPEFKVGDCIEIGQNVKDGDKERVQMFEGDVIAMHANGASTTVTVRRIGANNVGIERIFPLYSPTISSVRLVRHGKVRRAKLYYIRERIGKASRIKEKILSKTQKSVASQEQVAGK